MFSKLAIALLCFAFAADNCGQGGAGGAQSANTPAAPPAAATPAPSADAATKPAADVCALLQNSEVEAVQGGKVSASRPVSLTRGPLAVSQCHYTVTAADRPGQNLGVLIEVRGPADAGPGQKAIAEEWDKIRGKQENKRSERPRPVEGVGDEAFWVGSERLGALYVLRKGRLVYVSVGGAGEPGAKLDKSKSLALKALARL